MKRFYAFLAAVLITMLSFAQAPQKMSYQAVIRDAEGNLIIEQEVGMKISILLGTADGIEVYIESQTPTTNKNGLVSIAIGGEAGFADIDWSEGPYFLKTETDLEGGTNYTITSTSQLLSVPYALHASTAESITGGVSSSTRYVGQLYGGGVVFWVDHTGQHGLIISMVDLSTSQTWSNVDDTEIETTNDWDGASNTTAIIGQNGHISSAAKLSADYTNDDYGTGVYSDWYLPSVAELNHVWNNFYEVQKALTNVGNTTITPLKRTTYWSSSESDGLISIGDTTTGIAWNFNFGTGSANPSSKGSTRYVRAVRTF